MSWLPDAIALIALGRPAHEHHGARLFTFDPGIASLLATDTERERLLAVLH